MAIDQAYLQAVGGNTFDSLSQGIQTGFALAKQIQQAQQQQAEQQRTQEMQQDLAAFSQLPNKTADDYSQFIDKYPELSDKLKKSWDMQTEDQKSEKFSAMTQVQSALNNGNTKIARDMLEQRSIALYNSGKYDEAKVNDGLIKMLDADPNTLKDTISINMAALYPEKFKDIYGTIGEESRANEMQPVEIAQKQAQTAQTQAQTGLTQAQTGLTNQQTATEYQDTQIKAVQARNEPIRQQLANNLSQAQIDNVYSNIDEKAARLGLDREKLQISTQMALEKQYASSQALTPKAQEVVNTAIADSQTSLSLSNQLNTLADKFDKENGGWGVFSKAKEFVAGSLGIQTDRTALRQEYIRLRNQKVSEMLKGQGAITDSERAMFMKGFPSEDTDGKSLAKFLRTMSKVSQASAATDSAKAAWATANNGLGTATKDINVLGVSVPKGTSFNAFQSKNMKKILDAQNRDQTQNQIQSGQRSYLQGR